MATDEDLANMAAGGDRDAFARLFERHYDRLHRIAWRMTGTASDAEDVVQDTFVTLASGIGRYRGEAAFATWLTACAINASRDHLRRAGALARLRTGIAAAMATARPPEARDGHRAAWLLSGLARLPADLRAAVVLVACEGMTHADAGKALDVAESTVSWRMHEARKRLRFDRLEEAIDVR